MSTRARVQAECERNYRRFKERQQMATCKSCNAPITWAKTRDQKITCLDAEPNPAGAWSLLPGNVAHYIPGPDRDASAVPLYRSHWATCPNAAQHRKAKK